MLASDPVMSDPHAESGAAQHEDGVAAASDDMLLLGIRMRDENALAALYDRYASLVYTLALRMVHDHGTAESVMQDVFVRCWHGLERFDRTQRTLPGWLLAMTRRRALEVVRAPRPPDRARRRRVVAGPLVTESAAEERGASAALRSAVMQAFAELSPPQREAIELAYFEGLSQSEMAARLGHSVGTVKVRLRDGVRRLRRLLGPTLDGQAAGAGAAW